MEFPGRERLLGELASACAHNGKRERTEKILEEYSPTADWKHTVVEILISICLEEGKLNQANETFVKYSAALEGRDVTLARLVTACLKHSGWSIAANIINKYPHFQGRNIVLESCAAACRAQSKWVEAEKFLLELLDEQTKKGVESSGTLDALTEVYLENRNLDSAQLYCQKLIDARRKTVGKKHPLFQRSIYLMAKIIYEANGDPIEYDGYKNLLPGKIQGM